MNNFQRNIYRTIEDNPVFETQIYSYVRDGSQASCDCGAGNDEQCLPEFHPPSVDYLDASNNPQTIMLPSTCDDPDANTCTVFTAIVGSVVPHFATECLGYISFMMSASSDELTANDACTIQSGLEIARYHSGELPDPIVGDVIFVDSNGVTTFNGNSEWWKFDSNGIGFSAMKINTSGVVIEIQSCP